MTLVKWILLTLLVLIVCFDAIADDSKYIPMCLEKRCKEIPANTVFVLGGGTNLQVPGEPNETSLTIGYMRRITPELSLGGAALGTNKRFLGAQLGFGYHF